MTPIIVIVIIVGLIIGFIVRSEIKTRRYFRAYDLHQDMVKKYNELIEDNLMSDLQWKEWLPIFKEADRIFARDCPDIKFIPISLVIRVIIGYRKIIEN